MLRVAFAGLPSAGKSTMINALAGARFLETGVCRTTRAPCVLSTEDPGKQDIGLKCDWKRANMLSDDGIGLCVVDLPGICDAENTGTESNFTDLTMQWAAHCDVVVWVTDVRTCFLTSHEKLEYEKLKAALDNVAITTGRLFQFCVVLAKCDVDIVSVGANGANSAKSAKRGVAGEIVSPHEETTVADCVDRAKRLFPGERIVAFNAFGRIIARESSDALRALAAQLAPNSRNVNTELNMTWATTDLHEKRQAQMLRSIVAALGNGAEKKNEECLQADWVQLLDVSTKRPVYMNYKTGVTQYERPHGPVSSTKLNRELVDGLDENTTAMLMLLVLGVELKVGAWHHIVGAAGAAAKGLVSKNAERIGLLKHGPSAAQTHEAVINKRVEGVCEAAAALVEAMMHMCGSACIVTSRMYFKLLLTPRSAMKVVPDGYPAMLELDVQHNENRAIGMSVPWVKKVKEARVRLWGDAEREVCVTTVIALVREQLLPSVLSPPAGI
jgi:hypothetical protein